MHVVLSSIFLIFDFVKYCGIMYTCFTRFYCRPDDKSPMSQTIPSVAYDDRSCTGEPFIKDGVVAIITAPQLLGGTVKLSSIANTRRLKNCLLLFKEVRLDSRQSL